MKRNALCLLPLEGLPLIEAGQNLGEIISQTLQGLQLKLEDGDILVIRQTSNQLLPLVRKAGGLILEDDDPNGHGAIAGMSLDIPMIIGAREATKILKSGAVVTLDALRGVVSCERRVD